MSVINSFHRARSREAGLTLLEVLIALAIGVFLLAGIISLVFSVSRTRTELDKTSEHIENGRYALNLLREEISLAGFYGRYSSGADVNSRLPDPCATAATLDDLEIGWNSPSIDLPLAVGFDADTAQFNNCLSNRVPNSEVLVIHRVTTPSIDPDDLTGTDAPYVQISACDTDSQPFMVAKESASFSLLERDCTTEAQIWPYTVRNFYLSSCSDCGAADGIPTLKMAELANGVMVVSPLVEGVEDMHLEYGMDFDNDGSPDCYAPDPETDTAPSGCEAASWQNDDIANWAAVTTVRIHLLVRSIEPSIDWTDTRTYDLGRGAGNESGPFNDFFKRQVYSTVVVMPNVAGARE